ncbi:MAG: WbqC family protein [Bacteroidales bacterium]|nr:WbqC family protein [Bacteroidales bacterium]
MAVLLSTAYFPNIQYVSKFLTGDEVKIEIFETYPKQTFRNRCNILSANGLLPLSIPVQKNFHTLAKDIKIDYTENWQRKHSVAIMSAYKNSPFYEYYFYKLEKVFTSKETFLVDYNDKLLQAVFSILKVDAKYSFTEDFVSDAAGYQDFRDSISPKASKNAADSSFTPKPYIQVFGDRYGFVPNLSILDLIFNLGPESRSHIEECLVR